MEGVQPKFTWLQGDMYGERWIRLIFTEFTRVGRDLIKKMQHSNKPKQIRCRKDVPDVGEFRVQNQGSQSVDKGYIT